MSFYFFWIFVIAKIARIFSDIGGCIEISNTLNVCVIRRNFV